MIASHDSFTYLKPKNPLFNLISIFWKCQKLDITEQYNLGVRIFDVRVYRYKNQWGVAHGMVHFDFYFKSLLTLCEYFIKNYPDSYIRIYLEDNVNNKNENIKEIFLKETEYVKSIFKDIIWEIGTHFPWITYYRNDKLPCDNIKEYYCHLFNWNTDKGFWYNIKHFDWSSWCLPLFAKKHNPQLTTKMKYSTTMHILDYIGIYPKTKELD